MEKQILQVKQFADAFVDHEMPMRPTLPPKEIIELRQRLLEEEVQEMRDATNITEAADALMDILYIAIGTIHEYGLADRAIQLFDEVHRSNMSKLPESGLVEKREDGKILKPSTYSPPSLEPILERDFSIYRSLNEEARALEIREKIMLEQKVNRKIRGRLKAINPVVLKQWDDYLKTEKELGTKIKVTYGGGGINERYAIVDVLGESHAVKLNFSAPRVGGKKLEKKPTKKQLAKSKTK